MICYYIMETIPENTSKSPEFMPSPLVPEEQPFEYELLTGHKRTDGSWKSSEELKTEYVHLTDELIRKMTEGVRVVDAVTGETENKPVDYVVWIDKSARPVSWLTKELWPTLAVD